MDPGLIPFDRTAARKRIHRRFTSHEYTSTHAQGADPRVWGVGPTNTKGWLYIGTCDCESVSASERQDEERMPRETGTRQGRTPPTGDPHRGGDAAEDTPPEGRATQGTHTEHTQTLCTFCTMSSARSSTG